MAATATSMPASATVPTAEVEALLGRFLAEHVRRRMAARLSHGQLAELMGFHRTYVTKTEGGTALPTASYARQADRVLGAGGVLWQLWERWDGAVREEKASTTIARLPVPVPVPVAERASPTRSAAGAGAGLVVVSVEELAALIEESTTKALAACLAALGKGKGKTRPKLKDLVPTEGWPLAELVRAERTGQGFSLEETVRRMQKAAEAEGDWCAFTRQNLSEVERRGRVPHPSNLRWLAAALNLELDQVVRAAAQQRVNRRHANMRAVLNAAPGSGTTGEDTRDQVVSQGHR